jgi:hypothetical protein
MKMKKAADTCETFVNFYQSARRNNPQDNHRHIRYRENLKFAVSENGPV